MEKFLPLIIIFIIIVISLLVILLLNYRKCPKDKILVIYGYLGKDKHGKAKLGAKCILEGGAFVIPILQDHQFIDLKPISIEFSLMNSSIDNEIPIEASFTIGISTENEIMFKAVERLLGLEIDEIKDLVTDIFIGTIRMVVDEMGVEHVKSNKNEFFSKVYKKAEEELKKIGLKIYKGNIDILRLY